MSASGGASRRTVTVLFCDVVDSTALGERLDAEKLRHVQTDYFEAVREVLERHGGTVEKFIGDAVMAVFGLPTLHEDDALRALRAASELRVAIAPLDQQLVDEHELRWRIRVGVATGEVVAGDSTDAQSFATGGTVVVAQRLQVSAQPSEVLLDDATYRLAAGAAIVEPIDPVDAKGKVEPVAAWRLIGVQWGVPGVPRRLDTPLVGRRDELARLREAYDQAVSERRCRLVSIIGPAGIGKSRLVREFLARMAPEATIRVGRCPPYGDGVTFFPVVEVLPEETFDGTTEEIFRRVRRSLEEIARERPLVVCLDDLHWAEPTFLNLVDYLQGLITDAPVLLVCMSRAELLDARPQWAAGSVMLTPLSAEEADLLLSELDAPPEARPRITEAAEGNPLFAEQMAAMAAEEGPSFAVPPSIRALLAARLDRLPPEERAVVERAAVIGREFPLRAVAALAPEELRPEATSQVLALVRKDLVEPYPWAFAADEDGFRFRHGLIREAAYDAIPKELRAALHEQYARWFERFSGEDVIVGYHLEQAFNLRRDLGWGQAAREELAREAGGLLADAGERAYRRNDAPAAVSLLGRAVGLLPRDAARRPPLLVALGSALTKAGRLEESRSTLDEAIETARLVGDRRSELRATVERQQLRSHAEPDGVLKEIARVAAEVIPELEQLGDDLGLAKAWRLSSDAHVWVCRWQARAEALERAIFHARQSPEAKLLRAEEGGLLLAEASTAVGLLAEALHYGPTPAESAILRCGEFLGEFGDDLAVRAAVSATLGALLAMQARFDEARAAYDESVALHDRLGLKVRRLAFALSGSEIALLAGDPDAAERELRFAYEGLEEIGESGVRAVVSAALADVLLVEGRDEEALAFARTAAGLAEPEDLAAQAMQRATRARVLVHTGDPAAAEDPALEAVELAEPTDFLALQATAVLALADVREAQGREDEAAALLRQALELYERKGNLVAAGRLAETLAGPAPAA